MDNSGFNKIYLKDYNKNKHCIDCSKLISNKSKRCKSCCQVGSKNHSYKHGLPKCVDCDKELSTYNKTRCHSCENKRRHALGILNSKTANYKGGLTPLRISVWLSRKNKETRLKVFERDNYTCQDCNKKGIKLNSHHKIPISHIFKMYNIKTIKEAYKCKLLWDISWQITLCTKCHGELNVGQKYKTNRKNA